MGVCFFHAHAVTILLSGIPLWTIPIFPGDEVLKPTFPRDRCLGGVLRLFVFPGSGIAHQENPRQR